ncbi:hypothetical protein [Brumimicrobium mesophilum]|uniref:hypothetical protein n=1 Tax=Brumimicrobium mesophilum TaxID=392717 RepID=UPI00131AE799|nr:hypothetical protein [Brumimicrobium mesophilum]
MKTLSTHIFRIFSLASMSLLMAVTISCKKEKTEPSPSGPSNPGSPGNTSGLIASADLNFDGETIDFKCYNMSFFEEIVITEDSSLVMMFNSVNQNGNYTGGPSIYAVIENSNGFSTGDIYSYDNNSSTQEISFVVTRNDSTGISDIYGLDQPGSGELKITSLSGTNMKGVFNFTLTNAVDPTKQLTISNGSIDGSVFFEN